MLLSRERTPNLDVGKPVPIFRTPTGYVLAPEGGEETLALETAENLSSKDRVVLTRDGKYYSRDASFQWREFEA